MNAVVTISIGDNYSLISKLTHPTLKRYADKIGADFVVIDKPSHTPHWEKFQIYDLLVKYNRIIYLDTDLIVRDDCPNLFDMVPEFQLGIFNEGRFEPRTGSLQEACKEYGKSIPKKWDGTYYNTGVMVLSRRHRSLFKTPHHVADLGMFEQGYLNMEILIDFDNDRAHEERIYELDYKFNRMPLTDSHCGVHRCDSYIVHYAGAPINVMMKLASEDLINWSSNPEYKYSREIVIYMGGGMGDQLGSEPVARFIMERMFKDTPTNYTLVTNWPRFFVHLGVPCMVREDYEANPRYDTPVKILKTIPAPEESSLWQSWSHISGHTLDYAAVSTIHRILPDECREIHLQPSIEGLTEVMDVAGGINENMILVHPGRGWTSKTFPASWWTSVIEELQSRGKLVGVIGQQINKDQGYVEMELPPGTIDFRNMLSIDGLIAIIALSKLVISNDSAPIHIAGAFRNNILLIATCRHPDYILPYREGDKYYKAFAFAKKLTIDEWDLSPTLIFKESADVIKGNILDYLPTPVEVVEKAVEMCGDIIEDKEQKEQIYDFLDKVTETSGPTLNWNRNYEVEVSNIFANTLKPGDIAIDVGANVGIFTSLMSDLVGEDGIVWAFEPGKHNFNLLKKNINGRNNVRLMNAAVGDKNKNVELFFNLDGGDGNSLWDPAHHGYNKVTSRHERIKETVKMVTLDSIVDFVPKIIKTDTEGCELMVLKGAKKLLKKYKPIVIVEINTFALKEMNTDKAEIYDYMRSLGYSAYSIPDEIEIDLSKIDIPCLNYNVMFRSNNKEEVI